MCSSDLADSIHPGISQAVLTLSTNQEKLLEASIAKPFLISEKNELNNQNIESTISKSEEIDNNTLATTQGNEFKVELEDGTIIHLNYNTTLKYPVKFGKKSRKVYLDGEAYFQIAKDERPFYIETNGSTIKQYGTEFNVNTFNPNHTSIALVRGSISVVINNQQEEQFIKPGQLASINHNNNQISVSDTDLTSYIAWTKGRLVFDDMSLDNIMKIVEQWYKVKVLFGDQKLKDLHFTGNMNRYGTIAPILKAIARTTNLQIQIKDMEILITDN